MIKTRRGKIALVSILTLAFCTVAYSQDLKEIEKAYLKIVRQVRPSVVAISVVKTQTVREKDIVVSKVVTASFSGVIISKEGHIVTIGRGVEGAKDIVVETDKNQKYKAEFLGTDPLTNLAVVKVDAPDLTPIELGDSSKLEVGSFIVTVGNPCGLKHSVAFGNVSGLNRSLVLASPGEGEGASLRQQRATLYTNMIQISTPVSHNDPGGLVANSEGKLVGIISPAYAKTPAFRRVEELITLLEARLKELERKVELVKKADEKEQPPEPQRAVIRVLTSRILPADLFDPAMSQGINFAIPSSEVKEACDRIINKKKVAWLGVTVENLTPAELSQIDLRSGIVLTGVVKDGPADNAGLKEFDIITELDGKSVADIEAFRHEILNSEVGRTVKLTVLRKTEKIEVNATLGERPKSPPPPPPANEEKKQEEKNK
jgi:S1-C subfamily serine protease